MGKDSIRILKISSDYGMDEIYSTDQYARRGREQRWTKHPTYIIMIT